MDPKPCAFRDIGVKDKQPAVAEPAVAGVSAVADGQLRGGGGVRSPWAWALASGGEHDDESPTIEHTVTEIDGEWYGPVSDEDTCINFGVCCGNWGGDRQKTKVHQHMLNDIHESPGHVFCLQEATRSLCQDVRGGWDTPQDELVRYTNENRRRTATGSPAQHWLDVRGCEEGPSTAVAVRDAYVKGIRRDCFVLQDAGLD